jgi:hypothetical protein
MAPDEHTMDESSSTRLSSNHSTKDTGTHIDDGSVCVATAKATTIANCSAVSIGTFGTPVTISAMEASASPLVMMLADDGREGCAAMLF